MRFKQNKKNSCKFDFVYVLPSLRKTIVTEYAVQVTLYIESRVAWKKKPEKPRLYYIFLYRFLNRLYNWIVLRVG